MRVFFQIIIPLGILTVVLMTPFYLQTKPHDGDRENENTTENATTIAALTVAPTTETSTTETGTTENGTSPCDRSVYPRVCNCPDGYSGENCEITPCTYNNCQHGSCSISGPDYVCKCESDYGGRFCEYEKPCLSEPCQNGGTCIENGPDYTCECKPPFLNGKNCQSDNSCFEYGCPDPEYPICFLNEKEKPQCVSKDIGFMNIKTNKTQWCGAEPRLLTKPEDHAVEFTATEVKNRYKIKTHACDKLECYAAYKKVPDDPDYVWHKKPDEMDGYGDIWFFDLSYCDEQDCYFWIRPDDGTNRSWKDRDNELWIVLEEVQDATNERYLWEIINK